MNRWIAQIFNTQAAKNGGIVRRKVSSVKKYASLTALLREVRRRRFHLLRCGHQYVVLCNKGSLKVIR
jgi:hypothetical protein